MKKMFVLMFVSFSCIFAKNLAKENAEFNYLLSEKIIALGEDREELYGVLPGKNDYISFATYYWENPEDPKGPFRPHDGKKNHELIIKTDFPKKEKLFSMIGKLSNAYLKSKDEKYAKCAGDWLRAWFINPQTMMSPHLIYAQIRPNLEKEGAGGGIIDFWKMIYFLPNVKIFKKSNALTQNEWEKVNEWLKNYEKWLIESKQGKNASKRINNHRTYYIAQLSTIADFLGEKEKTINLVKNEFSQIDKYIEPDGAQPKEISRSIGFQYSIYNLLAWCELNEIAKRNGKDLTNFKSSKGASLQKAYEFITQFSAENPGPYKHDLPDQKRVKSLEKFFRNNKN